jgi:hypothetical protein
VNGTSPHTEHSGPPPEARDYRVTVTYTAIIRATGAADAAEKAAHLRVPEDFDSSDCEVEPADDEDDNEEEDGTGD